MVLSNFVKKSAADGWFYNFMNSPLDWTMVCN